MTGLIDTERRLYSDLLESVPSYSENSPGVEYLPIFRSVATSRRPASVLDAGCCTGKAGVALAADGFDVTLMDLTDSGLTAEARTLPFVEGCLWNDLKPRGARGYDYVFCCDVLEHVEPAFTMLAVHRMLSVSVVGAFFGIAFTPDTYGLWAGRALHQTVQPYTWWLNHLRTIGTVVDARDLGGVGTFFVLGSQR